jgi:hypothetical protein
MLKNRYVVIARGAAARQSHDHEFGEVFERDRHDTGFGEVTVRGSTGRHTWVGCAAFERDAYSSHDVPRFDLDSLPWHAPADGPAALRWVPVSSRLRR